MPEDSDIHLSIYVHLSIYIHHSINDNVAVYYYAQRGKHASLYSYFH